jgi:hypothetical protein
MFIRLKHLYALGHDTSSIASILQDEFQDIEVNPISYSDIEEIIQKNRPMLMAFKEEMALACKDDVMDQAKAMFDIAFASDNKILRAFAKQADQLCLSMTSLDLSEEDDNGKPKNIGTFFTLMEALERCQRLMERIGGTAMHREMMLYQAKKQIDGSSKVDGLLPPEKTGSSTPNIIG